MAGLNWGTKEEPICSKCGNEIDLEFEKVFYAFSIGPPEPPFCLYCWAKRKPLNVYEGTIQLLVDRIDEAALGELDYAEFSMGETLGEHPHLTDPEVVFFLYNFLYRLRFFIDKKMADYKKQGE